MYEWKGVTRRAALCPRSRLIVNNELHHYLKELCISLPGYKLCQNICREIITYIYTHIIPAYNTTLLHGSCLIILHPETDPT
jgi:hypothetical protein